MRPPLSKDIWYTDEEDLIQKHSFKQWNGKERRFVLFKKKRISFSNPTVHFSSLYFVDNEFYVDPKTLNDQENGGVAVALGRKVNSKFDSI